MTAAPAIRTDGMPVLDLQLGQTIEWWGIKFRVPDDWQIVRHGLHGEAGSLVLVDRRQQRLTVRWTRCRSRPDLARLVDDYRSRILETQDGSELEPWSFAGRWRGLSQRHLDTGEIIDRAVQFDPTTSRLIEALIATRADDPSDSDLVWRLLRDISVSDRSASPRRWRAFDLDVTTPPDFELVGADVKPADAALTFRRADAVTGRRTPIHASIRRLGMADAWHTGDLAGVIRRRAPRARFLDLREIERVGQAALLAEGLEAGTRLWRLLGRLRTQRALAWSCPEENAVYLVETRSPTHASVHPADFQVRCREGRR